MSKTVLASCVALLASSACCRRPCPPAPAPGPAARIGSIELQVSDQQLPKGASPTRPESKLPGYRAKTTPDTATDYRPSVGAALSALPREDVASLPALLDALRKANADAAADPGRSEPGHPGLGADPQEYVPSDAEIVASELGERIRRVVEASSAADLEMALADRRGAEAVEYGLVTFRHVDVMGSGRFFYASAPVATSVPLRK